MNKVFNVVFKRNIVEHWRQTKNKGLKSSVSGNGKKLRRKVEVVAGYKLCRQCVKEFKVLVNSDYESNEELVELHDDDDDDTRKQIPKNEEDSEADETPKKQLNSSLSAIGISPVNLHSIAQHSRSSNAK